MWWMHASNIATVAIATSATVAAAAAAPAAITAAVAAAVAAAISVATVATAATATATAGIPVSRECRGHWLLEPLWSRARRLWRHVHVPRRSSLSSGRRGLEWTSLDCCWVPSRMRGRRQRDLLTDQPWRGWQERRVRWMRVSTIAAAAANLSTVATGTAAAVIPVSRECREHWLLEPLWSRARRLWRHVHVPRRSSLSSGRRGLEWATLNRCWVPSCMRGRHQRDLQPDKPWWW